MKLSQLLRADAVLTGLNAADKWQAIRDLAAKLAAIQAIPSAQCDAVVAAIETRERSMSTGMEKGIAIPHAAVEGVSELAIALGIAPRGIPFESIDGIPASIVVLLVIPKTKKLAHIRTLAELARLLSQESLRKKLLAASDAAAAIAAIEAEEAKQEAVS